MKKYKVKIPTYRMKATLIFTNGLKEFNKVGKKFDLGKHCESEAVTFIRKDKLYILYDVSVIEPGTIAHECKHLVNFIFEAINHPLSWFEDEPECYLLGYLVNQSHKYLAKFLKSG